MAEFEKTVRQWARMCEVTQRENEAAGYSDCSGCELSDICCGLMSMKILEVATVEEVVMSWAAEHPEPVYPSVAKYLEQFGIIIRCDGTLQADFFKAHEPMSTDMAKLLGISLWESENEKTD